MAIDLGKYKSVACDYHASSGEVAFTTFDTGRAELGKVLSRRQPGVVVIEACALSGWVHDLCGELGLRCRVANTASEAGKFRHAKRRGRITRHGPALLRKLLVECAWCALRYNPWARQVYARLIHGGTRRKKQAIVALARKLLVRCWALLRDGVPWRAVAA